MKETEPEIKAGILIFVALIVLFVFTFMIGKFHFFKRGYEIKAVFDFAEGLEIGSPVRLSGVKVGSITAIRLDPEKNSVDLSLWLEEGTKIRQDSRFYLNTLGFMGEKYVEIDPGVSPVFLKNGDTVMGSKTRQVEELIRQGGEIASEIGRIVKSVRSVTDKVSLEKLEEALGDFRDIMKELSTSWTRILQNLNRVTGDIKEITASSKEDLQASISRLKETLINLDKSVATLNAILEKIEKGEGTVGALVSDRKVAEDMKEIIANFKVFSKDIRDNPSWLIMGKPQKKK